MNNIRLFAETATKPTVKYFSANERLFTASGVTAQSSDIEEFLLLVNAKKAINATQRKTDLRYHHDLANETVFRATALVSYTDDFISPVSSTREINQFNILLNNILYLLKDEEYDDDFLRPTDYAVAQTFLLIFGVAHVISAVPSHCTVSTDGSGGIRLEWLNAGKEVRVVVAASEGRRSYIYHEEGDNYALDEKLTPDRTKDWLLWLSE